MSELFLKVVNLSISASWLVLAVMFLRPLFKKSPKWICVLLWGVVALRLLCPVSIESPLSLIPSTQTIPMDIGMDTTPAIDSGVGSINSFVNPVISQSNTPSVGTSVNPLQITMAILSNLWLLGFGVMLLYTAVSYWRLSRSVATGIILRDNIYQSGNVGSPFVLGLLRPRIYLPYGLDEAVREHVIAHELAHIRRGDHWWKPLGFLLLTVHWFNPLMWTAYCLLCRDIELACDERVIREQGSGQRADYSQALVQCSVKRVHIAACPLAFGEVGVKERVRNVMNYRKPAFWAVAVSLILCAVVAVCFLTDPIEKESEPPVLEARILEIHDGFFLVEPVEGSRELNSADKIEVSMRNMEPSAEPEVGDILRIEYNGEILETYPARIHQVYRISVAEEPGYGYEPPEEAAAGYYLTIARDGVYSIEYATPYSSGGCCNADGTAYRKGERVWLELDGMTDLRGVSLTALDEDGYHIFSVSIPSYAGAEPINTVTCGEWVLRPVEQEA